MGNAIIRPEDESDAIDLGTSVEEMRRMVVAALSGDMVQVRDFFVTFFGEGERRGGRAPPFAR